MLISCGGSFSYLSLILHCKVGSYVGIQLKVMYCSGESGKRNNLGDLFSCLIFFGLGSLFADCHFFLLRALHVPFLGNWMLITVNIWAGLTEALSIYLCVWKKSECFFFSYLHRFFGISGSRYPQEISSNHWNCFGSPKEEPILRGPSS